VSTPLPRSEFAVTRRYNYLNNAAAGPLPLSSAETIEVFVRSHAEEAVRGTFAHDEKMPQYRERIGRYIGVPGTHVAIVPNTSAAAGLVASSFEWNPGDEVLLGDNEFPANAIPWLALRRSGVDVRFFETARERLTPDALRRAISRRTRIVAVSWVSYSDGYRHDLDGLATVAHESGAFLCVDAMQGLGAFTVDAAASDVDAFYAGGAKWMLSLHGAAIVYLSDRLQERLHLTAPGWRSVENMWDFQNYSQPFTREAMRFESGTPNLIGTLSLVSAVGLFERSGTDAIAAHVLALTDRFCDGLERLGANILTLRGDGISSGIVTFALSGRDSLEVGRALEEEGILTTYRNGIVRVSPHGYNSASEIDACLETLTKIASKKVLV
jgi:cysteine desulfurase / selenocysteine lyase